jgi:hypothetical protein
LQLRVTGTKDVLKLAPDPKKAAPYNKAAKKSGQSVVIQGVMLPGKDLKALTPLVVNEVKQGIHAINDHECARASAFGRTQLFLALYVGGHVAVLCPSLSAGAVRFGGTVASVLSEAPRLQARNGACDPGDPAACQAASRFSRIALWCSAALYLIGCFSAYLPGPILVRFD